MDVLKTERPELMKHYGRVEHELKDDKSVVTHLDKELEIKLKASLAEYDSKIGFWGEEFGREGNTDNYWLIDPIDGTEKFIRGMASSRSLVTFVSDNHAQYALFYAFVLDNLYTAIRGHGTTKNGQQIKMSNRPLNRAWIEFNANLLDETGYKMYRALRPKVAALPRTYDFSNQLDGSLDGYVVYKTVGGIWDYAPRTLLISEAGGKVANFGSDNYDIHDLNFIATNPVIFDQVQKILSGLA